MKAIIMAGGEGTRLRPLTCSMPKPLAPLCAKPVSMYIIELLIKHNISDAVFTLGYQSNKIISYFNDEAPKGINISYSTEEIPLGTAGSVKKACGEPCDVLIISGDAMCDFDLSQAIKYHQDKNADATIIVKKVSDPREYGLVLTSEDGKVRSFLEKPSYESCITDFANTGVYILSKSVVEKIPDNKKCDFAQDIFPVLLKESMNVYAYEEKGYWCDIGDFKSYLKCQKDMLGGLVKCEIDAHKTLDGIFTASMSDFKGADITPPVYIGKNVKISPDAVIESGSVICDGATISKGAKIHGSVILNGAYIGENVTCNEAVICENAKLLSGSSVFEGGAVGANAVVGENSIIEAGVRLWAGKHLESNTDALFDIKYGHTKQLYIDDEGICGETNGEITPLTAAALGASLGAVGRKIAVGYSDTPSSKALAYALMSGIMSSGADVWTTGISAEPELYYAMTEINADSGCFVDAGITAKLKVFGKDGLPLTRHQERKIEGGLNRSEYNKASFSSFGEIIDIGGIKSLYSEHLREIAPGFLKGMKAEVTSSNALISDKIGKILSDISDTRGQKVIFHISSDGKRLSAYSDDTGYIYYEKLLLICCQGYFKRGENVSLPFSAPKLADIIAGKSSCNVLRYFSCPVDESDKSARELAKTCRFGIDAIELMFQVLKTLYDNGIDLKKAADELPKFTSANRFVCIEKPPAEILKAFCSENGGLGEGVVAEEDEGRILIRPVKTGKGVMVFAESYKSETASELCDIYEKKLWDKLKNI